MTCGDVSDVLTIDRRTADPERHHDSSDEQSRSSADDHQAPAGAPRCVASSQRDRLRMRRSVQFGALVGLVPFLGVLWDFGTGPLRTAGAHRFGSNFYDIQARAFLDGDLAVPTDSLGIEGFVIADRTYMYFPPFPAFLRMPLVMFTERFDGRLTAPSMLLGWLVLAVATGVLVWNVRNLMRSGAPVSRTEGVAAAILVAAVTGGSVIVFDASLPWVYHEVYIWATALTVATLAGLLSIAVAPSAGKVAATSALAVAAILTRTTSGWAMALTLVAVGGVLAIEEARRRYGVALVAGGLVALAGGAIFNWAKFRHPFMFPLEHQIWTQQSARRRLALAMNEGTLTGPQFFKNSLVNYLRPDGIRFVSYFPFITLPARPAPTYGGAFVDQSYRTGSVPAFMPLLFVSTLWGAVAVFRIRPAARLFGVLVPMLGALAVTGGVMAYGYVAFRYTSEFLPVLIICAAVGLMDLAHRLQAAQVRVRKVALVAIAGVAIFGMLANVSTGFAAARLTGRGEALEQYVSVQHAVSSWLGGTSDGLVSRADDIPAHAPADALHIVGDCEALLIGTGDQYEPWVLVQARQLTAVVEISAEGTRAGLARLFNVVGQRTRNVTLETNDSNQVRLRIGEAWIYLPTEWYDVDPGDRIEVSLTADTARDRYQLLMTDGFDGYIPAAEWQTNGIQVVNRPRFDFPHPDFQEAYGIALSAQRGPPLSLCNRLLDGTGDR